MNKNEFINAWVPVTSALKSAVTYFKNAYGVPVSNLLPYEALLVIFTYYFYKHIDRPLGDHQKWLNDYFWRSVLSERFSSSADTKMNADAAIIDSIINDKKATSAIPVDLSFEYLKMHGTFTTSSAFVKGVLCLLCSQKPASFIDGTDVIIDNSWLRRVDSKNYHHFFPKAYMRRNHPEIDESLVNHIANITVVDDFLNKKIIKDRAPSDYILDFKKKNPNLNKALATHLIIYNDSEDSGINEDDYLKFFKLRLTRIINEFKSKVIITDKDRTDPEE